MSLYTPLGYSAMRIVSAVDPGRGSNCHHRGSPLRARFTPLSGNHLQTWEEMRTYLVTASQGTGAMSFTAIDPTRLNGSPPTEAEWAVLKAFDVRPPTDR